jgi:hypothetical protein
MRLAVLFSVCISLAITSLLNGTQFSEIRDLPPLRLAANELDAILNKTHSFIDAANDPAGQDSSRETVKGSRPQPRDRDPSFLSREQRCVPQGSFQVFLHL